MVTATPAAVAIPGVLDGGTYPNRWMPGASSVGSGLGRTDAADPIRLKPDSTDDRDKTPNIRPMIPLGQFRDTFIIAIDDEGVAIIDQHVAHERVLFERVMQRLTAGALESQRLLVPLLMELAPAAHQALLSRASELARLGYELDSFGESTLKVSAVPALLSGNDSAATT